MTSKHPEFTSFGGVADLRRSAELYSAVSQSCTLRGFRKFQALLAFQGLPIANRRYSRLQICATGWRPTFPQQLRDSQFSILNS
jgi:hypothetical protein